MRPPKDRVGGGCIFSKKRGQPEKWPQCCTDKKIGKINWAVNYNY